MQIRRLITVYDPELASLPAELTSALTDQDRQAIQDGEGYFGKLATTAKTKWMRRILKECADSHFELQFVAYGDEPLRPYYVFLWGNGPALSLPRRASLRSDMPQFLRQVYSLIGSIQDNGLDSAGGLHPSDKLCPISESGYPFEPDNTIDPTMAIQFLETEAGDQLCYLPDGSGVWLGMCEPRRVRNLEKEVAAHFEALLE
jgi:hypothetical protein